MPKTRRSSGISYDPRTAGHAVAHLQKIEEGSDGAAHWRPVRHHFGILGFGVSAWTGRTSGDLVIKAHEEPHEELDLVHQGHATFGVDGERVDAPAGTLVFVRPHAKRTAFAEAPATTIIAMGSMPGHAFEPDGWEIWAPLRPLYDAGNYERVIETGRAVIEGNPQYAEPMFNLACCESLLGRTGDALEHRAGRSSVSTACGRSRARIPTWIRSATSRPSRSSSRA